MELFFNTLKRKMYTRTKHQTLKLYDQESERVLSSCLASFTKEEVARYFQKMFKTLIEDVREISQ